MISIVNVGPVDLKNRDPKGWFYYELRINRQLIATFQHDRISGLGQCLIRAANAVEQQKMVEREWESQP